MAAMLITYFVRYYVENRKNLTGPGFYRDHLVDEFFCLEEATAFAEKVNGKLEEKTDRHAFIIYYYDTPGYTLHSQNAVNIGEVIVDPYRNTRRACYTTPDKVEEAKAQLREVNAEQLKISNAHYAQPWV
jgi:hypothetical protein